MWVEKGEYSQKSWKPKKNVWETHIIYNILKQKWIKVSGDLQNSNSLENDKVTPNPWNKQPIQCWTLAVLWFQRCCPITSEYSSFSWMLRWISSRSCVGFRSVVKSLRTSNIWPAPIPGWVSPRFHTSHAKSLHVGSKHTPPTWGFLMDIFWLVVSTPLKNISQIGSSSQLLGNIKMFQTTNQIIYQDICHSKGGKNPRFFS